MSMSQKTSNLASPLPQGAFNIKTRARAEAWGKKGRFYKPLPKEFRRDGFTYRQMARQGHGAIYEQRWCGWPEPSVCYEVIRVKRHEGFHIDGRFIEPAEVYPKSEDWGVYGLTFTNRDRAWAKFFEISLEEPARIRKGGEKWESRTKSSSAMLST